LDGTTLSAYIIRRLLLAIVVLILSTLLVFAIMHLLPGDPILLYLSQDALSRFTPEELAAARHQYWLDKPVIVQYYHWLSGVLHGDLGKSIFRNTRVTHEIAEALPITLYTGILAWVVSHVIAIPAGIICAVKRGKWIDTALTILANIGITAPSFWVGILLIYVFGLYLNWLPIFGYTSPTVDLWLSLKKVIMPVFCLCLFPLSGCVRQTRSAMLEVIRQDYIRTAWSKGLRERSVVLRHALKNGIMPVVTLAGMSIPLIIGGQVLIETVFGIPGMGRLAVTALFSRDYAIVQGIVLVIAVVVVLCNLIVDISYGWLDPRIRYA
jgi:peptide/nickel transport system permease protein